MIIEIKSCGDCPSFRRYAQGKFSGRCALGRKRINIYNPTLIHRSCPLKEKEYLLDNYDEAVGD